MRTMYRSADRARMDAAAAGQQGEWGIGDLSRLALEPLLQVLRRWWMQRIERHCLICADVEEQRARQAQQNVAYYQKQAAIARLAQQ